MSQDVKGGVLYIHDLNVPDSVKPGESFNVRVKVNNAARIIGPGDPDRCWTNDSVIGYSLEVLIDPGFGEVRSTGEMCMKGAGISENQQIFEFTFVAPDEPGSYKISSWMKLPGSGATSGELTDYVAVADNRPTNPDTGGESGGSGDSGGNGGSGSKNLTQVAMENPVGFSIIGIGGLVAVREAVGGE